MGVVVNTNISSITASRILSENRADLEKSMERGIDRLDLCRSNASKGSLNCPAHSGTTGEVPTGFAIRTAKGIPDEQVSSRAE